jgi:hypothetical protein
MSLHRYLSHTFTGEKRVLSGAASHGLLRVTKPLQSYSLSCSNPSQGLLLPGFTLLANLGWANCVSSLTGCNAQVATTLTEWLDSSFTGKVFTYLSVCFPGIPGLFLASSSPQPRSMAFCWNPQCLPISLQKQCTWILHHGTPCRRTCVTCTRTSNASRDHAADRGRPGR